MPQIKIVRPAEVAKILSISIPTLYRRSKDPDFPRKITLSDHGRAVGWLYSDIEDYLTERIENRA